MHETVAFACHSPLSMASMLQKDMAAGKPKNIMTAAQEIEGIL